MIVIGLAVGIGCAAVARDGQSVEARANTDLAETTSTVLLEEKELPATSVDQPTVSESEEVASESETEPETSVDEGESTTSYTIVYPNLVDHARYQGIYPDGVPILTCAQVESVTPAMTWRQIYEGFGLQKALPGGIAFGVEGNRLLLLDWDNPDAPCARTGAELLDSCLTLWKEDREDGRFVTFSDAVGILTFDPQSGQILFGEWSLPKSEGRVSYNTNTGEIQYIPSTDSAPSCILDENQNPVPLSEVHSGRQGFAKFSDSNLTRQQNGMLKSASIERLILLDTD